MRRHAQVGRHEVLQPGSLAVRDIAQGFSGVRDDTEPLDYLRTPVYAFARVQDARAFETYFAEVLPELVTEQIGPNAVRVGRP